MSLTWTAKVAEIFKSIQGEGPYQGVEQVFVRFFDCNLDCKYCDTLIPHFCLMAADQIVAAVERFDDYHSISFTGGEPLLESVVLAQVAAILKAKGKRIYLETNGTLPHSLKQVIEYVDIISMDFKLSTSTGLKPYWVAHRDFLKIAKQKELFVKVVVSPDTQIEDLRIAFALLRETKKPLPFILQPEYHFESVLGEKLVYFMKICKEEGIDARVISQLHRRLGVK